MSMDVFRFKYFEVSHSKSSMKVGVDSVALGAWATSSGKRILDVGTGCGIIALMIAQRNLEAIIEAIDIDENSIKESEQNFSNSPWGERLKAKKISFEDISENTFETYDLIISNPPFHKAGLKNLSSSRLRARHQTESFNLEKLIEDGEKILKKDGRLAFILPYDLFNRLPYFSPNGKLRLKRVSHLQNRIGKSIKRTMVEYLKNENTQINNFNLNGLYQDYEENIIVMFDKDKVPTEEYRHLCKDFYLKF